MLTTTSITFLSALIAGSWAQQACNSTTETHPSLTWSKCTSSGCTEVQGSVVVDANWRWTHTVDGSINCYTGNEWDTSICTDGETCAEKCCVDGADYSSTYGVTTSGSQLNIGFVTKGAYSTNIGSRLYLMEDTDTYQMFTLLGNEFTFDVDVSGISCGLNGALYFVSMDEDGGLAKYDGNKAGAKYGTGYCDAQCARDVKFINGVANVEDWEPSTSDSNSGIGKLGTCCPEMDIWEANDISTAYTAHPCKTLTQHSCEGDDCGGTYSDTRYAGDCDPDGCDFNPYRQGHESFYGPGSDFTIDTTKKMTVVTQFIEGSSGSLSQIKRYYVQDNKVVANSQTEISRTSGNNINSDYCTAQKEAFGDKDDFANKGGFSQMSDAIASPMVLVMSLWDDHHSNMLWLDSTYPANSTASGSERGTCSTDSGVPATVESETPNASVVFSNIKFGPIGSTFDSSGSNDTSSDETSSTQSSTATAKASATEKVQVSSTSSVSKTSVSTTQSAVQEKATSAAVTEVTVAVSTKSQVKSVTLVATSSSVQSSIKSESSSISLVQTTPQAVSSTTEAATTPTESSSDDEDCDDSDDEDTDGTVKIAAQYYQCGGINWTGATTCATGYTCKEQNAYYYQCV